MFLYPNFEIEKKYNKFVIGVDEVGRGPLAGPIVSCACLFFDYSIDPNQLSLINDSKKLSLKKRMAAFKFILKWFQFIKKLI